MVKANAISAEPLKAFASAHTNTMYDVVALLAAAAERIDAATPVTSDVAETMHNTLRLVQMAGEKAKAVADLMFDET